jgi:hypothetical protein
VQQLHGQSCVHDPDQEGHSGDTRPDPASGPLISRCARDRNAAMAGMARYGPARRAVGRFEP